MFTGPEISILIMKFLTLFILTKLQVPLIYQLYFFDNRCLPNIKRTHLPFYFIFFLHVSSAKEEKKKLY
jgi:hypothetical protein